MDLIEICWIGVAHDKDKWRALMNVVMTLQVLKNAEKVLSSYTTDGFWSSAQLNRVSQCVREHLKTKCIIFSRRQYKGPPVAC
jgi:hypothetical protein